MKKLLLALAVAMGLSTSAFACAHVDMNDSSKAIIYDTFVQDLRDENFVHMGDEVGLFAEMRGDIVKKIFVYVPASNKLYKIDDIQLVEATKSYDLRWLPHLQKCYARAKAKVDRENSK